MIRTTITIKEFEKLTWMAFEDIASDMKDITVTLVNSETVVIHVLGYELKTMSVSDYNSILNG